jgi:mRNA interferase MazF
MVNKWEIYNCDLDPTKGSEQKGFRPVLVISNDAVNHNIPIVTILPFSSFKKNDKIYPTEVFLPKEGSGLSKDSIVMIQQIRTISQSRLIEKIGSINNISYQVKINEVMRDYFEI